MTRHVSVRTTLTFALALVAVTSLGACATPKVSESTGNIEATALPANLPDGIPLPRGGSLAAEPRRLAGVGVSGWSAVALMPFESTQSTISAEVSSQLKKLGWTVAVNPVPGSGTVVITAKTPQGVSSRWLHVTITAPIPQGGPAVTYRFASGAEPVVTPS